MCEVGGGIGRSSIVVMVSVVMINDLVERRVLHLCLHRCVELH